MLENNELYLKSTIFGAGLGLGFGMLIGIITGSLSASWHGVLFSAILGAVLGMLTGSLTGALTVWTAGRSGGVSSGAYTGMAFGALLGGVLGIFIPDSFRASIAALHILILDVLTHGRFETAVLLSFQVSITATMVGSWIGGRNLIKRDLKNNSN
jgi:MFS family permease